MGEDKIYGTDLAFPTPDHLGDCGNDIGLTKLEYFASMAMQAMISNPNIKKPSEGSSLENDIKVFSETAVSYSKGLIDALNEPK